MDSKRVSQGEPPAEGKGNDCLSLGKECNPGEAGQLDFSGTSGLCPDNPEKAPTMCQASFSVDVAMDTAISEAKQDLSSHGDYALIQYVSYIGLNPCLQWY